MALLSPEDIPSFNIQHPTFKIVSAVPSLTELLYSLGLDEEVVGITKFCVHPDSWFRSKTRVGGTKQLKVDFIKQLQPDLIIANKEENVKEQIEELAKDTNVFMTDINSLEEAYDAIIDIGKLTGTDQKAKQLVDDIKAEFSKLNTPKNLIPAAYLIWREPYMTIGGDTFINDIMKLAGFRNVFENKQRYPEVSIEDIKQSGCGVVLLSSEPYPFKEKHIKELQEAAPGIKVMLVDGEMFSWYGSRLLEAPKYFSKLL